eukprot:10434327-Lingulodinium_polyedra.AAC.1
MARMSPMFSATSKLSSATSPIPRGSSAPRDASFTPEFRTCRCRRSLGQSRLKRPISRSAKR